MFVFRSQQFTVSVVSNQFRSKNHSYSLKAEERKFQKPTVEVSFFFAASDKKIQLKMKELACLLFFLNNLQFLIYTTNFDSKIAHIV